MVLFFGKTLQREAEREREAGDAERAAVGVALKSAGLTGFIRNAGTLYTMAAQNKNKDFPSELRCC